MRKILITGENSYVGVSFKKYLNSNFPGQYLIDELSVKGEEWKKHDFSPYEVVFHVAGIAHVSTNPNLEDLYYTVNRDLTLDVAKKSKSQKVKQFVFMSSMIVFGKPEGGVVNKDTNPIPENFYGRSKLEAEEGLRQIADGNFKISILRPPMIYGPGSKGNYPKLAKLARVSPIFPNYPNKRSMLFIDNLSIYIKDIIDNRKSGTFHPQNNEYVQTSQLVKEIAKTHNHKIWMPKIFNPLITHVMRVSFINKIFGDLYYFEQEKTAIQVNFSESIKRTQEGSDV